MDHERACAHTWQGDGKIDALDMSGDGKIDTYLSRGPSQASLGHASDDGGRFMAAAAESKDKGTDKEAVLYDGGAPS